MCGIMAGLKATSSGSWRNTEAGSRVEASPPFHRVELQVGALCWSWRLFFCCLFVFWVFFFFFLDLLMVRGDSKAKAFPLDELSRAPRALPALHSHGHSAGLCYLELHSPAARQASGVCILEGEAEPCLSPGSS